MTGGGNRALPGEISMAHNGVLFLDELPEFSKTTLEVLRQPLEDRKITISRAKYTVEYPCSLMFVASMNPCPCGYYGDPTHHCVCTPGQISRYLSKISGPLLDRIEFHQFYFVGRKFFITLYPKYKDYGSYRSICPSFNVRSAA
jgi:magnesium chelatase family protein